MNPEPICAHLRNLRIYKGFAATPRAAGSVSVAGAARIG